MHIQAVPDDVSASRRKLRTEAKVGFYSFKIGSAVRVKRNVEEPRHQWGQVRKQMNPIPISPPTLPTLP